MDKLDHVMVCDKKHFLMLTIEFAWFREASKIP